MTHQSSTLSTLSPVNSSKIGVLNEIRPTKQNQDENNRDEDFDGLLVGMISENEANVDVSSSPEGGGTGESMPLNGNNLPLDQDSIIKDNLRQVDSSGLLKSDTDIMLETDDARAIVSIDTTSSDNPGDLLPVTSDSIIKQTLTQISALNKQALGKQSMFVQQGPSVVDSTGESALSDQALPIITNKPVVSSDSKNLLNSLAFDIGPTEKKIILNRSLDKVIEKSSVFRSTAMKNEAITDSVVSLVSPNVSETKSVTQLSLPQVITSQQWANDFGERIRWLISNNINRAEIRLNPGNLGMIEVSISVSQDQTNIQITAQNSQTKEALDDSLARLREMLEEAGAGEVDINVSQHSEKDQANNDDLHEESGHSIDDEGDQVMISEQNLSNGDSLIDFYA